MHYFKVISANLEFVYLQLVGFVLFFFTSSKPLILLAFPPDLGNLFYDVLQHPEISVEMSS